MIWDRIHNWLHSPKPIDSEIAVIRTILPTNDPRSEQLLRQALDPPSIRRQFISRSTYRLSIPHVKDSRNLIEAEKDYISPTLTVKESASARELAFTLKIRRGGFLHELSGSTVDGGDWPRNWTIEPVKIAMGLERQSNWLPIPLSQSARINAIQSLAHWCGGNAIKLLELSEQVIVIREPATISDVRDAEARLGRMLPLEYRRFVEICNGFSIQHGRPYEIFGTADVYLLSAMDAEEGNLVLTNLYENGVVAMRFSSEETNAVATIGGHTIETVGSLREYLRDTLAWAENLSRGS